MRTRPAKKRKLDPDLKYQSVTVSKFINKVMLRGQKETARKLVYRTFDILKDKTGKEPLEVFETALKNAQTLAMRWMINTARKAKGATFEKLLADEILAAYGNTGSSIKQKENMHKMAEANKAFAHYARF
jgi:small subunit ribosomal protein S7